MRAREVRLQVAQSGTPDSRREPAILPLLYFPGTILEQKRVVRFSCACANTKAMNEIAIMKRQPFIIDNGEYRAVIEERASGGFGVQYFFKPYSVTHATERSPCSFPTLEEAAQAALARFLERVVMAKVQHGPEAAKP